MLGRYRPVIVVIKKHQQKNFIERSLELPISVYSEPDEIEIKTESFRGISILKIHGDEKI
tara:strand:+ start:2605 stop:2784 length:180 start_codon:yes stop_codon:yes gene_type:complete